MHFERGLFTACVVLLLTAVASPAWGLEPKVPIMPVSEIEPGMKAKGRTVYEAGVIEDFEATVLGVLPSALGPGQDVILVRLTGDKAERFGVAAGMSGSPVYIDGKLIGALSLAYGQFQREPIAGVTPIESMIQVSNSSTSADARGARRTVPVHLPDQDVHGQLVPVRTPITLSGFDPAAVSVVNRLFEPYGFAVSGGGGGELPVSASNVGAGKPDPEDLTPGSAVSGILMQGDLTIQGTGTLTYADDENALAFGHAFLLYGDVEMPLASAHVLTTVPLDSLSFKVAYPKRVLGAFVRDNRTAMAGRFDARARMIPVQVKVKRGSELRTYNFEIFRNQMLTTAVLTAGVTNALVATADYSAEGTMIVEGRIVVDGYPDIELRSLHFDPGPQGFLIPSMLDDVTTVMGDLFTNSLAPAKVQRVELSFVEVPGRREVRIEGAWADRTSVRPGEEIGLTVRLRPHQGKSRLERVKFRVPEKAPSGELQVVVSNAEQLNAKRAVLPTSYNSTDLGAIIKSFNERRVDDSVYVRMTRAASGIVVRGVELDALPPSVLNVIQESAPSEASLDDSGVSELRIPVDARVEGEVTFNVTVR